MKRIGKYLLNFLIGIDQLGNAILAGDPDETISSRLGKIKQKHGGRIPWRRPLSKLIDAALDKIDKDHCEEAIEHDEGGDALCQ